jgi:hypothetical protein
MRSPWIAYGIAGRALGSSTNLLFELEENEVVEILLF